MDNFFISPSACCARRLSLLLLPYTSLSPHQSPIIPSLHFPKSTHKPLTLTSKSSHFSAATTGTSEDFEYEGQGDDDEEEEGEESPWEGAVVYRRDASVTHVEYSTTLERLGLGNLSSELSKSRASDMGIRIVRRGRRMAADPSIVGGTPVLVSVDITRKKKKLTLDGIVRTVITLGCNSCGGASAKSVYSNLTMLLSEEPIEEPEETNLGTILGEDDHDNDNDEKLIDFEDQVYFPSEQMELDISKQIRDLVHVEITINSVCDVGCKGMCLKCGANLNKTNCRCRSEEKTGGPLQNLREQMEQKQFSS